jgi:hypothetical protein
MAEESKKYCSMKPNKSFTLLIGIDPGVNTGVCVYSTKYKSIHSILSLPIHRALESVQWISNKYPKGVIKVRFEDARLRKWIPRQKTESAEKGRREGAGSVKRDCKIWEDFLTYLDVDFEMVPPKNNKTKVSAEYFKKLTGYEGKTNEHSRDAAMLVIGY